MRNNPPKYAERPENFAENTVLHSTLREVQTVARNPRVWTGIAAVVVVLTVAGPFGTDRYLGHAERLVYWSVEAVLTFFCGLASATAAFTALDRVFENPRVAKLLSGLAPAIPVSLIVWLSNLLVFGSSLASLQTYVIMLGNCLVISFAITVIYYQVKQSRQTAESTNSNPTASPFLKRLPVELGRNLLHVSSQDHYVQAVTDRGSHLILMRFADALGELEMIEGIRVHRAHWIAKSAIAKPLKKDGRLYVETTDGETFPVSRTYLKQAREFLNSLST